MSNEPTLLFLHGIGDGDREGNWEVSLAGALVRLGYPDLATAKVIAPKYAHALKGFDEESPPPPVTIKPQASEESKQNRRNFERRMGAVEYRLGSHNGGKMPSTAAIAIDAVVGAAFALPLLAQARNFLNDRAVRANVLSFILSKLPKSGRLVIVGHSLGSVIAADLIRHLPIGLKVAGLVTIGSPLANGNFDVDKLRDSLKEPPANLDWWVNFWNAPDPVAAHRGLASVFPWLVDFRIATKTAFPQSHSAVEYLANERVAEAVGYALFGSTSRELAIINSSPDIPFDAEELVALLALRYAHLTKMKLTGEKLDRFGGALRHVQATAVAEIQARNDDQVRAIPFEIARLKFDLSDPHAVVPEPFPVRHYAREDTVVPFIILATYNVIRPFDISTPKDSHQQAMNDLGAEMGLGSQYGAQVREAVKDAQDALSGGRGANWVVWSAIGAGVVVLAVATGGLFLAAGPGLAGAAATTSALAAFGPGGMIGGLVTAGTLATAGGGGIAFGLASSGTTAETLEVVVVRQLAATILRQRLGLAPDPAVWSTLVAIEIEVRREHERLDEFSDESSPGLKELRRKIETVERALKYMRQHGLEPGVPASTDGEAQERRSPAALLAEVRERFTLGQTRDKDSLPGLEQH